MGESKLKLAKRKEMLLSCAGVQTITGRVQARWDAESTATPMGQLAYFIEFLTLTGRWSRWLESGPLSYSRPNAPSKAEVLSSVGHRTEHAGKTTITLTGLHAHFQKARAALMRVSALLQAWAADAAEPFCSNSVWTRFCNHLKPVLAGIAPPAEHQLLQNHAEGIG